MSVLRLLVLCAIVAVALAGFHAECETHFGKFMKKHRKVYESDDHLAKRLEIFCNNMKSVDEKNEANGTPVFGVTKFSDHTREEVSVLLGRKNKATPPSTERDVRSPKLTGSRFAADATNVDWTKEGMVTPVKNQGQCGSCWAHSAAEQIESEWMLAGNAMWEFSVQQVNSCVKNCFGCGGGDTPAAYEYLMGLQKGEGLGSSAWAPYVESMTEQCTGKRCTEACKDLDIDVLLTKSSLTGPFATVTGYDYATPAAASNGSGANQNMTLLAQNIATHGPASICVNAANWSDYTGGVMSQATCGGFAESDLDHCVQLTGYNADANPPYWIVRNSWATDWGENGYIYLEYPANSCGLGNEATFVNLGNANNEEL